MSRLTVNFHGLQDRLQIEMEGIERLSVCDFEWKAQKWRVRFQSWIKKPHEGEATLGLRDDFPENCPGYMGPTEWKRNMPIGKMLDRLAAFDLYRESIRQQETGWHLKRTGDRVSGWFDLNKLPVDKSSKKPFASFDVTVDQEIHRCQFHIWELAPPGERPVAWDNRRGASAGRPSGGKRR